MKKERENNLQFSHKKYIKYVDEGPMHMDNGVGTDCGSGGGQRGEMGATVIA